MAIEVNATLGAGERPLLCMPALVEQEADFQAEAPATLRAAEGPLTGVSSPVVGETGLVCKALGAIRTGERALSAAMDSEVVGES